MLGSPVRSFFSVAHAFLFTLITEGPAPQVTTISNRDAWLPRALVLSSGACISPRPRLRAAMQVAPLDGTPTHAHSFEWYNPRAFFCTVTEIKSNICSPREKNP